MPFPEGGPNARKAGLPEKCSKEEAKAFARDAWTDEYEAKFDAAATDGKVARSAILAEVPATNKGLVIFFVKLTDPTKFKVEYLAHFPATLAPFGGTLKAKLMTKGDGAAPHVERTTADDYDFVVVLEFPSVDDALAWDASEAYQKIKPARLASATGPLCIFEGTPNSLREYKALQLLYVKVTDKEKFAGEYLPGFGASLTQDGAELGYLVGKAATAEGMGPVAPHVEGADAFHTCVVVGFPDLETFTKWHDSDVYKPLGAIRYESTEGPSVAGPCL